jgi:hypothetical protein
MVSGDNNCNGQPKKQSAAGELSAHGDGVIASGLVTPAASATSHVVGVEDGGIRPVAVKPGDLNSWETFQKARESWPSLALGQAWQETPDETLAPGRAWFAVTPADVIVGVEFVDADIFNPATRLNELGFLKGDVMELFWKPAMQEAYYEIHVSPRGQILQLKFPGPQTPRPKGSQPPVEEHLKQYMVKEPLFSIRLLHVRENEKWGCVVAVPGTLMRGASKGLRGEDVTLSVCRYDYSRALPAPTISSTSQHMAKSFHRSSEWRPCFL